MIRSSRAWSSAGRRITAQPRISYLETKPGKGIRGWMLEARRYESTSTSATDKKPTNQPSFTSQVPAMPDLDAVNATANHTATSTADSIPIPSMPPPPPPIPSRETPEPSSPESRKGPQKQETAVAKRWHDFVLEPIYMPLRAYGAVHKRRPYLTQFVSALVIYFVGDMVAQGIGGVNDKPEEASSALGQGNGLEGEEEEDERPWIQKWHEERDWWRTGRALIIGGVAAVPGFKWFVWLSNSFNYRSRVGSLCVKVLVNQTLFTPIFNTYFFSMQSLLNFPTPSAQELYEHISNTVPRSCYNSCKIWPAVTAFSFAFVRLEYRSLVAGVVAIGWQTYLSLLDTKVRREERERHALVEGGGGGAGAGGEGKGKGVGGAKGRGADREVEGGGKGEKCIV